MFIPDNENDGVIHAAIASPHEDDTIALDLMYYECREDIENKQHKYKRFFMRKSDAQVLMDTLVVVLALPPDEARDHISENMEEHDPNWDEYLKDESDGGK
jgi:hypothetical protein